MGRGQKSIQNNKYPTDAIGSCSLASINNVDGSKSEMQSQASYYIKRLLSI